MAETSEITWTDSTFNPWIGCTKVSPACDFCYAERDNGRRKWVPGWGPGVPRKRTSPGNWRLPIKWQRESKAFFAEHGRQRRVFAASLADIFDNEVPDAWRADFWELVRATPNLQWLILTKRISNARKMLPPDWGAGYPNVVLVITVANQEELDRDGPKLEATPARLRGLSIEPMLGPITLVGNGGITFDWIIGGGESDGGAGTARSMHSSWIDRLVEECRRFGVPFHFKQWGEWGPDRFDDADRPSRWVAQDGRGTYDGAGADLVEGTGTSWELSVRYGKKANGREVRGVTYDGFPAQ